MTTDLRQLLAERSQNPASPPEGRLSAVLHRVEQRRRAQTVGALSLAAIVVLALASVAAVVVPAITRPVGNTPSVSPPPRFGGDLPTALESDRIVAKLTAVPPQTEITIHYAPTSLDLVLMPTCPVPGTGRLQLRINDKPYRDGVCYDGMVFIDAVEDAATYGLAIGQPATFTMAQTPAPGKAGRFTLEIGVREFPPSVLPAPPPTVAPLQFDPGPGAPVGYTHSAADPMQRQSFSFVWQGAGYDLLSASQAPVTLDIRVTVNGVPATTYSEAWPDYAQRTYADRLEPGVYGLIVHNGDTVTITVVPHYATGEWVVMVPTP